MKLINSMERAGPIRMKKAQGKARICRSLTDRADLKLQEDQDHRHLGVRNIPQEHLQVEIGFRLLTKTMEELQL